MAAEFGVERFEHRRDRQFLCAIDRGREIAPEIAQQRFPIDAPARHLVELVFEIGGEIVFDVALEEARQKRGDEAAAVFRDKAALIEPHIVAILQHLYDRGVGRRPSDAQLFQFLDEAGFAVARRRLREMLVRRYDAACDALAVAQIRQTSLAFLLRRLVAVFLVELQKTVEHDDRTGHVQPDLAARIGDVDADLVEQCRRHLAGDCALPDQLVEAAHIVVEMARDIAGLARHVGRADRLVRLLRVFRRALVDARLRRQIAAAEFVSDQLPRRGDRLGSKRHPVGAHVRDEADGVAVEIDALIKPLRDLHCARRAKAELARCFLLQCRCREGRERIAPHFPVFDRGDIEPTRGENFVRGGTRLCFAVEIEAVEFLAIDMRQFRREAVARFGLELDFDRPVFAGAKRLDLGFALADQTQRDRLHAPGRAAPRQFAPQHRRQGEADEIIERPARQIGIDQFAIDLARMTERVEDGVAGHLVEHDALDVDILQRAALLQHLAQMPRNRLAFAVGVGREKQFVGAAHRLGDRLHMFLGPAVDLPGHVEIIIRPHRAIFGRQVADMAVARHDLVVAAEIFIDRFGLGRRFDDDDVHRSIQKKSALKTG